MHASCPIGVERQNRLLNNYHVGCRFSVRVRDTERWRPSYCERLGSANVLATQGKTEDAGVQGKVI